ncbi:MAG: MFS transporter, partial [Burkholderiales bacterium]
MLAVVGLVAMSAQLHRNAHVVVAPDITLQLSISPEALGGLSGALFVMSAIFQIPGGVIIDRYGPRKSIPVMLLISMIGALIFALAPDVSWLIIGRAFVGVGMAVTLMAAVIAATRWFDAARFGIVTGMLLGVSQLGNLLATAPMGALAEWVGWRGAFFVLAALTGALTVAAYVTIRDAPPEHPVHFRQRETLGQAWQGVLEVMRIRAIYPVLAMSFSAYAAVACVIGLWGGPFLADVYGMDTVDRGAVLAVIAIGLWIGNSIFGWLDHRTGNPRRLVTGGAIGTIAIFAALALARSAPLPVVLVLFALFGLVGSFTSMIISHGRTFYPDRIVGRGMTVVNQAVLLGVAVLQWATGLVVGAFGKPNGVTPPEAYQTVFG